jgi:hypothetical protein
MYNKNKGMSSFKNLKNKLQGKSTSTIKSELKTKSKQDELSYLLELEEARYLLSLVAKSDFNGKDIQIVYNVALKLQNQIKSYIEEENVKTEG